MSIFQPLGDRVLVKPLEGKREINGIIIPDSANNNESKAVVVSVGAGKKLPNGNVVPVSVKENDIIFHTKFSGSEIFFEATKYLVLKEEDILMVISE